MKDLVKQALLAKKQSKSNLVKVGCSIEDTIGTVFTGYNGHGFLSGELEDGAGMTKPGVIHAEADAIAFACKMGTIPLYGAKMVVTTSPCMNCAALIINSGIRHVYYIDPWWDVAAIDMLVLNGVRVTRLRKKPKADTNHPDTSPSIG